MICDHADPCKEVRSPDQLGLPNDYMISCGVFKPKKKSEYDLCHFYQVGLSGDLPEFPWPHTPATHEQVSSLLLKVRALGWPMLPANGDQSRGWLQTYLEAFLQPFLPILQEQQSILHESYLRAL